MQNMYLLYLFHSVQWADQAGHVWIQSCYDTSPASGDAGGRSLLPPCHMTETSDLCQTEGRRDRWGGWLREGGGLGSISDWHKIISLWIISVSELKSLATDCHFETECHFSVTVLFFACSSPCPLTSFPPPFHSLAQLPPGQPSCGIVGVIFRFANSATEVPSFWTVCPRWSWHRSFGKSFPPWDTSKCSRE